MGKLGFLQRHLISLPWEPLGVRHKANKILIYVDGKGEHNPVSLLIKKKEYNWFIYRVLQFCPEIKEIKNIGFI